MRANATITQGVIDSALSSQRSLNTRVWIRDDRMYFSDWAYGHSGDAPIGNGYEHHAMALSGDVIYRVVAKIVSDEWRLYTQRITDPTLTTWPDWVQQTPVLMANTAPGVFGLDEGGVRKAMVWGRDTDGYICTYKYNPADNTVDTVATSLQFASGYEVALAPVSETECYALVTDQRTSTAASYIHYIKIDANREVTTTNQWHGVMHSAEADWNSLSAVRMNGLDYCYFSVDDGKRSVCITSTDDGVAFSNPQDIFPLDYADDIVKLEIGNVTQTLEHAWICGILTRSASTQPMQIYTLGPENFTVGREMFIGSYATTEVTRNIGGTDYTFPAKPGQIIAHGNYIWFIVPGTVARAVIPRWLGGTSLNSWYYTCNRVSASFDKSGNASMTVDVPVNIHSSIRPGMTLILQVYVDSPTATGGWFDLDYYEIDAITEPRTQLGKTKAIVARPKGIKRLSQWRSDASYDYWSQEAKVSNLSDQGYNVRVTNFSTDDDNNVVPRNLSANSYLYNAGRTSIGYAARVKFSVDDGRFSYVGPIASLHTETRVDAAARLGVDPASVSSAAVRTSGILFMYHDSEEDPGWRLHWMQSDLDWSTDGISNCPWTVLQTQVDQTLANGEYEMMIVYNHGRVDTYYRSTSDTDWSRPLSRYTFNKEADGEFILPYSRTDGRARSGYFARSELNTANRTRILETGYSTYGQGSILWENKATIEDASYVEVEDPPSYNGTPISRIYPRSSTWAASRVTAPYPLAPSPSTNIIYGYVLPWQTVYHPGSDQQWLNSQHDTILSEDGAGPSRWVWLDITTTNVADDYRAQYNNLDYANSGLGIHALDGAIVEFYDSTRYDGCAATIDMVDWRPPAKWVPLWPNGLPFYPYTPAWTQAYYQSTGYNYTSHPNDNAWGYWANQYDDRMGVGTHLSGNVPELMWCVGWGIRVRLVWGFYDSNNAYKFPAEIHFRPNGLNTNQTRVRIYLPDRASYSLNVGGGLFLDARYAQNIQTPLMYNKWVRAPSADTPVGKKSIVGSAEPDCSFSWMAKEICRKAGVLNVSVAAPFTSFSKAGVAWEFNSDQWSARLAPKAGIVRFQMKDTDTGVFGMQTGPALLGGGLYNGTIITASTSYIKKWVVTSGSVVLSESIPMADDQTGLDAWVTISFNGDRASVWVNDALVAVFEVETDTKAMMMTSKSTVTTAVDWPVLDMRVDNFVCDINQIGVDLLRRLIKRKRVHFLSDSEGGIKIFRDGEAINTQGTAHDMILSSSKVMTDTPIITRLRLEGIDAYEALDTQNLKDYGNVFAVENFDELETHAQFVQEGDQYLEDVDRATRPRTYIGPADPRVEPWDTIWINDGTETIQVMVSSVTFNLLMSEEEATFDMQIEAEAV